MAITEAPGWVGLFSQSQELKLSVEIRSSVGERNMCNRGWVYALPLTVLFGLQATTSLAQEAIGKATSVRPQAEGSHAGPLSSGSSVYSRETVRTGDSGQAGLQFHDHSHPSIRPY